MPNIAVVAVGRPFFVFTIGGMVLSIILGVTALVMGVSEGYFTYELDRCDCVPEGEACAEGVDFMEVGFGWQDMTISGSGSTTTCLLDAGYEEGAKFPLADPLGEGFEVNGMPKAAEGFMVMMCITSGLAFLTHSVVKASYVGNGSHCSIGLTTFARLCFLSSLISLALAVSYWWLLDGRFGDDSDSVPARLTEGVLEECSKDWDVTAESCPDRPWQLTLGGWALMVAMAQVGLFFITSLGLVWRAPIIEGMLDGSIDDKGNPMQPRRVEVELVVGKALATDGDPDYDIPQNIMYEGNSTMVRPYPLPVTAKQAKGAAVQPQATEPAADEEGGSPTVFQRENFFYVGGHRATSAEAARGGKPSAGQEAPITSSSGNGEAPPLSPSATSQVSSPGTEDSEDVSVEENDREARDVFHPSNMTVIAEGSDEDDMSSVADHSVISSRSPMHPPVHQDSIPEEETEGSA